jgi:hypothetical protein
MSHPAIVRYCEICYHGYPRVRVTKPLKTRILNRFAVAVAIGRSDAPKPRTYTPIYIENTKEFCM